MKWSTVIGCLVIAAGVNFVSQAGGPCSGFYGVRQQVVNHHVVQPVKQVVQQVCIDPHAQLQLVGHDPYYSTPSYERQSLAERIKATYADPEYAEYLRDLTNFEQYKAYQAGLQAGQIRAGTQGPVQQAVASSGVLQKHCGSCHGDDLQQPKGGVYVSQLTCDQVTQFLAWHTGTTEVDPAAYPTMAGVVDRMRQLPNETKQEMMAELLRISQR